jgi:hypothetical protein
MLRELSTRPVSRLRSIVEAGAKEIRTIGHGKQKIGSAPGECRKAEHKMR